VVPAPSPQGGAAQLAATTGFEALPDNNTKIPPDTMGAVGPNHLVVMLNSQVRIQDKSGAVLGTVSLSNWWTAGSGLTGSPYDPRIIYDSLTGRWMAVVDANARSVTDSRVWLAVSETGDPTGVWLYYELNMESPNSNALWHDFPDIGTNRHWIALTNNMYDDGDSFAGLGLIVLDKTTLGGVLTCYYWNQGFDSWGGYSGFTMRPALTFDPAEDVLYMVDGNYWADYPLGSPATGLIRLSRITGTPATGPTCSHVPDAAGPAPGSGLFWTTESYDPWFQINASQPGTVLRISTNDTRILNAVFRNGRLWFTHTGGFPNIGGSGVGLDRTVACWYEVAPLELQTDGAPVQQSGTFNGGSDVHYFFPSISVNRTNDAVVGFTRSSPSLYAEAALSGRRGTDPAGAMDAVTTIKAGEDSYVKVFSGTRVRWGDYSATCVDPVDDRTFWSIQEYADLDVGPLPNDDRWGTWWVRAAYPHAAGPASLFMLLQ